MCKNHISSMAITFFRIFYAICESLSLKLHLSSPMSFTGGLKVFSLPLSGSTSQPALKPAAFFCIYCRAMNRIIKLQFYTAACLAIIAFLSPISMAFAQQDRTTHHTPETSVRLISKTAAYVPGQAVDVSIQFQIAPGWHIYAKNPGEAGLPTEVTWHTTPESVASPLQYPPHTKFDESGLTTYGYSDYALFTAQLQSAATPKPLTISAAVSWLACKEICIPGSAELSLTLPIAPGSTAPNSPDAFAFPDQNAPQASQNNQSTPAPSQSYGIWVAMALAILGGIILNLMPCVFPVLALKVFHFAELSQTDSTTVRRQSLIYVAGVLCGFAGIGGLLAILTASGEHLGWGYQLQNPAIVFALAIIMLWVGLDMAEFAPKVGALGHLISRLPAGNAPFQTGLLAVAVASPCTAPFMGGALGFAALQSPAIGFLIIMGVGLGFALPFLIFAWMPGLARHLPKPGPWMLKLKKLLALPMLAAAAWLLWVLSHQVSVEAMISVAIVLFLIAISCIRQLKRHTVALIGIAILSTLWFVQTSPISIKTTEPHATFSKEKLAALRANNVPVFVDFTADWCITCKVNEASTLNTKAATDAFARHGITRLTADWTRRSPEIGSFLKSLGRNGVPVYALYGPDPSAPILLPEILTPGILASVLDQNLKPKE